MVFAIDMFPVIAERLLAELAVIIVGRFVFGSLYDMDWVPCLRVKIGSGRCGLRTYFFMRGGFSGR
jgi:hypothetical protein